MLLVLTSPAFVLLRATHTINPRGSSATGSSALPAHLTRSTSALYALERPEARLNLLYDSKCALCQWEVHNLQSLGSDGAISFTDIESDDYDETDPQNGAVTYREGMERIHAVTRDGQVLSGIAVFASCYEQVGLGWPTTHFAQSPTLN